MGLNRLNGGPTNPRDRPIPRWVLLATAFACRAAGPAVEAAALAGGIGDPLVEQDKYPTTPSLALPPKERRDGAASPDTSLAYPESGGEDAPVEEEEDAKKPISQHDN
ncbi:hypothetical protein HU200_052548 [Digitaria exilis]|uniref:Uncharacterized protein n=1 Tax=Digitaria exilis TaxID=1010633 RepID=A0A835AT99_9POAL|nr:hypothetical protein HU200_052548 [Digitaria exilis]